MRVGLLVSFIREDIDTNRAAPMQTREVVRSPAGCWRYSRSSPMTTPSSRAVPTFSVNVSNSSTPASWSRAATGIAIRDGLPYAGLGGPSSRRSEARRGEVDAASEALAEAGSAVRPDRVAPQGQRRHL